MLTQFSRTELLLGKEAMEKLQNSRVAVFGIGGVGGYVCEALARSGVGAFDLIDDDKVCLTNLNRQIIATRKTVGQYKTDVMKERMLDINPDIEVNVHKCFFLPENADDFPWDSYDYVVDAVDTVKMCLQVFTPMIATMKPCVETMYKAAQKGFINATDMADYLTAKGLPFRSAYQLTGRIVADCIAGGQVLESLTLEQLRSYSGCFDEDIYDALSLDRCVSRRRSPGGPAPDSVYAQIQSCKEYLAAQTIHKGEGS